LHKLGACAIYQDCREFCYQHHPTSTNQSIVLLWLVAASKVYILSSFPCVVFPQPAHLWESPGMNLWNKNDQTWM
jgi:hypothetical protein